MRTAVDVLVKIIKEYMQKGKEEEYSAIFDDFIWERTGKDLWISVKDDAEFRAICSKATALTEKLARLNLTEEQQKVLDDLVSIECKKTELYGSLAYRCGIQDGLSLAWGCEK